MQSNLVEYWSPVHWVYNCCPLPAPDCEVVALDYMVSVMQAELDACTEEDCTPRGRVLHVAHMLVSHQGADGLWPATLNLRTSEAVGSQRSDAPCAVMRRLNQILESTEFDWAISRAEAGIIAQTQNLK